MIRTGFACVLLCIFVSCVGRGKYKRLETSKLQADSIHLAEFEKLQTVNAALANRNEDASNELIKQNTLLSQLLSDKIALQGEVSQLKDRISSLNNESRSLEAELTEELKQKNENLKAKEAKLNAILNWYLKFEADLREISGRLAESMTGYTEDDIDWYLVDHHLDIILYQSFLVPNRTSISSVAATALDKLGSLLSEYPSLEIVVEGHTDNAVSNTKQAFDYSTRWATLVATYFLDGVGINSNQVTVAGKGGYAPRVSNQTPAGRVLNNRVEVRLRPPMRQLIKLLD